MPLIPKYAQSLLQRVANFGIGHWLKRTQKGRMHINGSVTREMTDLAGDVIAIIAKGGAGQRSNLNLTDDADNAETVGAIQLITPRKAASA